MSITIEWVRNPDGTPGETVNPIRFRNLETGKVGHYCEKISLTSPIENCHLFSQSTPDLLNLRRYSPARSAPVFAGELLDDLGMGSLHDEKRKKRDTQKSCPFPVKPDEMLRFPLGVPSTGSRIVQLDGPGMNSVLQPLNHFPIGHADRNGGVECDPFRTYTANSDASLPVNQTSDIGPVQLREAVDRVFWWYWTLGFIAEVFCVSSIRLRRIGLPGWHNSIVALGAA